LICGVNKAFGSSGLFAVALTFDLLTKKANQQIYVPKLSEIHFTGFYRATELRSCGAVWES